MGDETVKKLLKPYEDSWFEKAISDPQIWKGILAAGIILTVMLFLPPSGDRHHWLNRSCVVRTRDQNLRI